MSRNQNRNPSRQVSSKARTNPHGDASLTQQNSDLASKRPPQNQEAEQAVLGGVFLRNSVFHSLVDMLGEEDFYYPAHGAIFRAFRELYSLNSPIDLVTVSEHLQKTGHLEEAGGAVYLSSLMESVASAANALSYAEIVQEKAVRRELIQRASQIINSAFQSEDETESLLDRAETDIFQISEARTQPRFKSSKELVDQVFEYLEQRFEQNELITGVPTDYHDFDELTAGLQRTDLIILAGRPSMGKTAFGLNVAMRSAVKHQIPTAIFSLEMSMDQLMMRMLCAWGHVGLSRMRSGFLTDEDWAKLYQAAEDISQAPIYIDDTPSLDPLELRARCRRLKGEKGLGMVVVDYLQLMHLNQRKESREQEISHISRNLKSLAKEIDVPVVALAQLNRKVEDRTDKRPMLSDLRESGAIEQDADLIVFLYRDEVYNTREDNPNKGIAEIIVGKQRNGPVGKVKLSYLNSSTAFENLAQMPAPSEETAAGGE
ncbi:MAG: replicative DNA helicase [Desulfohalobiaceae bacterium]|nr:replicative DNA helicase [Desulfohalobiaceae bacterium]